MGHHIYKDINIPIKYMGKIIVVDDFIMDYVGVDRMRSFEKVVEWIFKDGCFESAVDLSSTITEFRTELQREIAKKNVNSMFLCVDSQRFESLSNMHDTWWTHLV